MSYSSSEVATPDVPLVPLPNDFVNYYPWACGQFEMGIEVVITKMIQSEYVGTSSLANKAKQKLKLINKNPIRAHVSRMEIVSEGDLNKSFEEPFSADPMIKLTVVYNLSDKVTHVKFNESNFPVPQKMIKVLGLFIHFHPYLITLSFGNKIDQYVIYELSQLVRKSNIVEVYLDGCNIKEANYNALLSDDCDLKILSLARCNLTDTVLKTIVDKLDHLDPACRSLVCLNLSSNRITDVGAEYIAQALRSNRKLAHLNLSSNMISDDGMFAIFDIMLGFAVHDDELVKARGRHFQYLQDRIKMINELVIQITEEEFEKMRRKTTKVNSKLKGINVPRISRVAIPIDTLRRIHDRAEMEADMNLGKFIDPVFPLYTKDDVVHCYGNNTLQSLNVAYNGLTILSLRKAAKVLIYQKRINRKPKGLINLNFEGNPLPIACQEALQVNKLLEEAVYDASTRAMSTYGKKQIKSTNSIKIA